ncbi:MAG: Uma2 family endonuclease [Gammaproteobacteria bacterium]|nr:Uma2 family endonuclease [Gammaproteobacteria bacterium]
MSSVIEVQPPEIQNAPSTVDQPLRHRWTIADYFRMGEVGLLDPQERVELIEGDIIEMAPIGNEHAGRVDRLNRLLNRRLSDFAIVRVQNPILLDERNAPEPDLAILRFRDDFYETAHPTTSDVLLLIEVSDSTARFDRHTKAPLYARHGIAEFWLLDLTRQQLEIYRDPQDGQYRQVGEHPSGTVSPLAFPDIAIDLTDLFPGQKTAP